MSKKSIASFDPVFIDDMLKTVEDYFETSLTEKDRRVTAKVFVLRVSFTGFVYWYHYQNNLSYVGITSYLANKFKVSYNVSRHYKNKWQNSMNGNVRFYGYRIPHMFDIIKELYYKKGGY